MASYLLSLVAAIVVGVHITGALLGDFICATSLHHRYVVLLSPPLGSASASTHSATLFTPQDLGTSDLPSSTTAFASPSIQATTRSIDSVHKQLSYLN
jgi:hypothetical protein